MKKNYLIIILIIGIVSNLFSCIPNYDFLKSETISELEFQQMIDENMKTESLKKESMIKEANENIEPIITEKIYVDFSAPYATYSIINSGYATLYKHNHLYNNEGADESFLNNNAYTVAINAGHGTKGGTQIKTFSHPDFSPKVSGGSNPAGEILSYAVSDGLVFDNGMTEAEANLMVAMKTKEVLLDAGYNVLMIRENDDLRLDNIARTVIANNNADVHISIHFDSTNTNKGIFYISPINVKSFMEMEPVKSNAHNIDKLGTCLIEAFRESGQKIWSNGALKGDLTQISYSTNASVDIELGDKKTEINDENINIFANGIKKGVDKYFYGT